MMNLVIMILVIIFGLSSADKHFLIKIDDEVVSNQESEIPSTPKTLGQGPSDRKISIEPKVKEHNSGEKFSVKNGYVPGNFLYCNYILKFKYNTIINSL